jgi:hypothetical protein
MAKSPPLKNTVGEGFAVEERIVGWLACYLLSGTPWPAGDTSLIQFIDCQGRQDGWFFDDTVVTRKNGSKSSKCGCSIKSFPVFGTLGAPADFARNLWAQWNLETEPGFKRKRDRLVLFSSQHAPEIREAWFGLTEEAKVTPPETMASRFERGVVSSQLRDAAFASLQRPSEAGGASHTAQEVAELLGSLTVIELDFEHIGALGATTAHSMCQQALADSARSRAGDLWEAILAFSSDVRRKGGRIDLPKLLDELAHRFPLKNHPDYAADWASIVGASADRVATIPCKLAGKVSIDRQGLSGTLERESANPGALMVLGGSGNGKSVLARSWVQEAGPNAVWLTDADLSTQGGLRSHFNLTHTIADLFAGASGPGRLVLDGLDKCFNEGAFNEAALILRAAAAPACKDRWRAVLTCCPEDWSRVSGELTRREVHFSGMPVEVGRFSVGELAKVASELPVIGPVLRRPHLSPILCWPKALDIVARNLGSGESMETWATESALATWFWERAIRTGGSAIVRDQVARRLAVLLGDQLIPGIPLANFSNDEVAILRDLTREGKLSIDERRRSIRFAHELIADWARQAELQSQGEAAGSFLKTRLASPSWHRAVRFHGLELLESSSDASEWERFFRQFSSSSAEDTIAQNLLLEAPVFAVQQRGALVRLWPILIRDKGALLKRFLKQFLQVATVPDERKIAQITSGSPELALQAATILRFPWPPYWFGVLQILGENLSDAVELTPDEVADVCLMWLPLHDLLTEGMRAAANLAVASARDFAESERKGWFSHTPESTEEKICKALLAASYELPADVTDLALSLSGRRKDPELEEPPPTKPRPRKPLTYFERGRARPWSEGPQGTCSPVFRRVFMHPAHSAAFLDALPEVATEVMFSVLLDLPHENDELRSPGFNIDDHGFARGDMDWHSCFWTNGPFLAFLRTKPATALPAIIRLVNFASDRSCELSPDVRHPFYIPITIEGEERQWKGHQYSYLWHKGHVFGPKAAECALLSLEKWLYDLQDQNLPIDGHLLTILRESRSIALASVLICVGKRKPELFRGVLKPLLAVADYHQVEALDFRMNGGSFRETTNNESSQVINDLLREWVSMPHRKTPLDDQVLLLSFQDEEWHALLTEIRAEWKKRLDADPEKGPPWLASLILKLDRANWRYRKVEGHIEFSFHPPDSMPAPPKEVVERLERMNLLTLVPFQCEQILERKKECPLEQLVHWWSQLEQIRATYVPADAAEIQNPADALCGIVAVAISRHRIWLSGDPNREKEALKILRETVANPPQSPWFFDFDSTHYRWDTFAASAIATLWCEKPDEPFLSDSVAAFAMSGRYIVGERVLMVAAEHRSTLGTHFERLLAHAIRYAPVRDYFRHKAHAPSPMENDPELQSWRSAQIDRFRKGSTEALPESWLNLAEPVVFETDFHTIKSTGLDIQQIYSALTWAADLSKARDPAERAIWLRYHRQYLLCSLIRIKGLPTDKEDDPFASDQRRLPYRDEDQALERIGTITAHLDPSEDHPSLWEPLFNLGTSGAPWIRRFTSRWMLEGAGHRTAAFIDQWKAMVAFAESSTAWKEPGRRSRDHDDLWHYLLGFLPATRSFWDKELAPAVLAVRDPIERWAAENISSRHEARTYIHFLHREAARALRINGLLILRNAAPPDALRSWTDSSSQDALTSFLGLLLAEDWNETMANPSAKDAFMAFVLKLVSLQNPLGSELLASAKAKLTAMAP